MTDAPKQVTRVTRAELRDFRGWAGDHTKDKAVKLDADIVLVTAANGRGKSSLIEALARVLNGGGFHDDEVNRSLFKGSAAISETPQDWSVTLDTDIGEIARDTEHWRQRLDPEQSDVLPPDVLRRATSFRQDRLDEQFEAPSGDTNAGTLLKFLAPLPPWLEDYGNALRRFVNAWEGERPQEPPAVAVEAAQRRRDQAAAALVAALRPLVDVVPVPSPDPLVTLATLVEALTGRDAKALEPESWIEALERALQQKTALTEIDLRRIEAAHQRLDQAQQALEAHQEAWPDLPGFVQWAEGVVDLERILELVAGLASAPPRWGSPDAVLEALSGLPEESRKRVPHLDEVLRELPAELARVDRARAGRYRDSLALWKTFWGQRKIERRDLEIEHAAAEAALQALEQGSLAANALRALSRFREVQSALRDEEKRRADAERQRLRWEKLQTPLSVIRHQLEGLPTLQEGQLDAAVTGKVNGAMNAVMAHFIVAGIRTSEVVTTVKQLGKALLPRLTDGRTLADHASTGQTAQMAFAWLLGSNALLQKWLPHRLLLLDDVSTALDLTNLAAECALLRKFAYTTGARRRQVIVASHHDQLTHRMFDLLLPPGDYTLREIRLVDWDMVNGPTVEASPIKATRAATDATRKELGAHLETVFTDRLKWRRAR